MPVTGDVLRAGVEVFEAAGDSMHHFAGDLDRGGQTPAADRPARS